MEKSLSKNVFCVTEEDYPYLLDLYY